MSEGSRNTQHMKLTGLSKVLWVNTRLKKMFSFSLISMLLFLCLLSGFPFCSSLYAYVSSRLHMYPEISHQPWRVNSYLWISSWHRRKGSRDECPAVPGKEKGIVGRVGEGSGDLGMETALLSMFINEPKKEMTNKLMEGG